VPRLVAAGHDVWGVDRAGAPSDLEAQRHITADLTHPDEVTSALERSRPQWIVHLAAQASVRTSFDEPIPTVLNNTLPTLHILDWLRRAGVGARLLAIGSAEEYGVVPPDALPLAEVTPANPSSPYALAKSLQNQACRAYASLYGVDVVCTRSFNHTGAGQRDAFVLPSFARQMCEMKAGLREAVLEVGNLDVRRDFLDVRDVCAAYEALLERGQRGETYNVCSGRSRRLHDLVERLSELAGVDVEIKVDPQRLRPVDMPELRGDGAKIEAATGWKPTIEMDDTLRSLLDYWSGRVVDETSNRRTE
jgi:GDP-4-dehydro-6-deoxy-D-mannose reductase